MELEKRSGTHIKMLTGGGSGGIAVVELTVGKNKHTNVAFICIELPNESS